MAELASTGISVWQGVWKWIGEGVRRASKKGNGLHKELEVAFLKNAECEQTIEWGIPRMADPLGQKQLWTILRPVSTYSSPSLHSLAFLGCGTAGSDSITLSLPPKDRRLLLKHNVILRKSTLKSIVFWYNRKDKIMDVFEFLSLPGLCECGATVISYYLSAFVQSITSC